MPPKRKASVDLLELVKSVNASDWGVRKFEDQPTWFDPYGEASDHNFAIDPQAMTTFQACCQECGGLERVRCRWVDRSPHWVCPCDRIHAWNIVEMGEE